MNLGLRYELTTVVSANNNLLGNFLPGQGIAQVGSPQLGSVMNGDHKNFAPRVGFAWDVAGNGRTVVRGGAGIYYSQASFDSFMSVANLYGLRTIPTGVPLYTEWQSCADHRGWMHLNIATHRLFGLIAGLAEYSGKHCLRIRAQQLHCPDLLPQFSLR